MAKTSEERRLEIQRMLGIAPADVEQATPEQKRMYDETLAQTISPADVSQRFPNLDRTASSGWLNFDALGTRAMVGAKVTKQGELNALIDKYGKDSVVRVADPGSTLGLGENYVITTPEKPGGFLYDPGPSDSFWGDIPGDIADQSGNILRGLVDAVAMIGIGGLGGAAMRAGLNPMTVAKTGFLSGVASEAVAQTVSRKIPGNDMQSEAEIGDQLILSGTLNAAGAKVADLLGAGYRAVARNLGSVDAKIQHRARNIAAKRTAEAADGSSVFTSQGVRRGVTQDEFANRSELVKQRVRSETPDKEFFFSPGQHFGNQEELAAEMTASNIGASAPAMQRNTANRKDTYARFARNVVDKIAKDPEMPINEAVRNAGKAGEAYLESLNNQLIATARPLFNEASRSGQAMNMSRFMAQVASEMSDLGVSPEAESTVSALQKMYDRASNGIPPGQFQNLMAYFGRRARRGELAPLPGMAEGGDAALANRLLRALEEDLDFNADQAVARAANGRFENNGAKALVQARDIWRKGKEQIRQEAIDPLVNFLELAKSSTPEQAIDALGNEKAVKPRQIEHIFNIIKRSDPDAARNLTQKYIERHVFEPANIMKPDLENELGVTVRLGTPSPEVAQKRLTEHVRKIHAMVGDNHQWKEDISTIIEFGGRMQLGPGWVNSSTVPQAAVLAKKWGVDSTEGFVNLVKTLASEGVFGADSMAAYTATPKGAAALAETVKNINDVASGKANPNTAKKQILRSMPYLLANTVRKKPEGGEQDGTTTGN